MYNKQTYSELVQYKTFEERFKYLQLNGVVGEETFGPYRYLNQRFYTSYEWQKVRQQVIFRDKACDLGIDGMEIIGSVYVHHIKPITVDDLVNHCDWILDPEYLISMSLNTHNMLHYGQLLIPKQTERFANDTIPWKRRKET